MSEFARSTEQALRDDRDFHKQVSEDKSEEISRLRAALLEAEAKVKALQAVTDLLDPRENMTREVVCAYLEANGLKRPVTMTTGATDASARGAQPLTPRQRECPRGIVGHIYVMGRCACGAYEPSGVGHGAG